MDANGMPNGSGDFPLSNQTYSMYTHATIYTYGLNLSFIMSICLSIYLSVCLSFFLTYLFYLSLSYIAYKTTSVSEAARTLQQEDECPLGTMAIKFEVICSCPEGYFVCICMYKLHVWQKPKSHGEREGERERDIYIYIRMYFILYMMQILEPVWLHTSKNTHIHRKLHRRIHAYPRSIYFEMVRISMNPWGCSS